MADYKRRLVIVVSGAAIWFLGAVWIVFNPGIQRSLGKSSTAFTLVVACLCAASICACYLIAKRLPRFALGLIVLTVYFALLSVYVVSSLMLNIDSAWIDRMHYLIQALLPVATLILLWQGMKKLKEDKTNKGKKEGS
jgi:drug/metabolite transporter (DMT)-like permease